MSDQRSSRVKAPAAALLSAIKGVLRSDTKPMHENFELKVHLAQDAESGLWYISDSDIPGLWLEAESPVALIERIRLAAPEMIKLNEVEIVKACREKARKAHKRMPAHTREVRPSILPVFDSPFELAYAAM